MRGTEETQMRYGRIQKKKRKLNKNGNSRNRIKKIEERNEQEKMKYSRMGKRIRMEYRKEMK